MGCSASHNDVLEPQPPGKPEYIQVTEAWDRAWKNMGLKIGTKVKVKDLVVRRSGWKTIRIFVSSTFKDFHQEREMLVKKIFPDLRLWCENRRLNLIECDLRWGVPKDMNTEGTLRACLGEIDRCYEDNIMPFFLNMTSERVGWVPSSEEVPDTVKEQYSWIEGLSVTEMEIMHAAYRVDNPNAIFMLRDPSFLEGVPEEYKKSFVEGNTVGPLKLSVLRTMIQKRFPETRIRSYKVQYLGYNPDAKLVELGKLEDTFSREVLEFFKERIAAQYPPPDTTVDPFLQTREQHEAFMHNRAEAVFGREKILKEIENYISKPNDAAPYLLVGGPGTGKSSIMSRAADVTTNKTIRGGTPGLKGKNWLVFYHFVGAVPGSTELEALLKRLLVEMKVVDKSNMPKDLETAVQLTCGALTNPHSQPTIIIIDALNQLDNDLAARLVSWVPRKLAPQIRCVFSMIPDTPQHTALMSREPQPKVLPVTPLDMEARKVIVTEMLGKYNKRLDTEQLETLLSKESSANPLWLSMAIEELRVFGMFRKILDKINQLADGLLELEIQIIERFERESDPTLLVATLCLMEVSARGLLETELLTILGDERLAMPEYDKDADTEKSWPKSEYPEKLPAFRWAEVYRNLKPFLRPFGDSGEGRLDFYHRSLSKAVRKKYFSDDDDSTRAHVYKWWHTKLADYFERTHNCGRKLEEYPVHLLATNDHDRLTAFLTDWDVFDALFDEEFSTRLVALWRESVGFDRMEDIYVTALNNFANSSQRTKKQINERKILVSRYFAQAGRFATAQRLVEEAISVEIEQLNGTDEQMAELYHLNATIQDDVMNLEEFMYHSQLPTMRSIIENYEKSACLREKLPGERQKRIIGIMRLRQAYYYSGYEIRGGDDWTSAEKAKENAIAAVEEALNIFTELDDQVHIADCLTTKGATTFGRADPQQIKCYTEAEELLLRTVGELHVSFHLLYLNTGIYYEDCGDHNKAFDAFYKWYKLSVDLYGPTNPKCVRSIATLREEKYQAMLEERNLPIPELPAETS